MSESEEDTEVHQLARAVAQEFTLLACVSPMIFSPMIFSNVAVDMLDSVFATDASNQKGAVVAAKIEPGLHEHLWPQSDRKGSYTHLDNSFHAILRQVGDVDDDLETAGPAEPFDPTRKQHLLYFDFVEICGGAVTPLPTLVGRSPQSWICPTASTVTLPAQGFVSGSSI